MYLLTDVNGRPYKNTSFDFISLPSKTRVADFRDAVKGKNSNKLSFVDASDLKVFKNKESFDAGEEPLKAYGDLKGLGESEENALIVVAPSPSGKLPWVVDQYFVAHLRS